MKTHTSTESRPCLNRHFAILLFAVGVCVGCDRADLGEAHAAAGPSQSGSAAAGEEEKDGNAQYTELKRLAEKGDPWGMFFLGLLHSQRLDGVPASKADPPDRYPPEAASTWAKFAAALDSAKFDASHKEAAAWFGKAAAKGLNEGKLHLGLSYFYGHGVVTNQAQGIDLMREAAEAGQPQAMTVMGVMHMTRVGPLKDLDVETALNEALSWLRRAIDGGEPFAMFTMGVLHLNGLGGGPSDSETLRHSEALRLFRMSAEKGQPEGMTELAKMLLEGKGTTRDVEEAVAWFTKAAERGHVESMLKLGDLYMTGTEEVAKDNEKGLEHYAQAARIGEKQAVNKLVALADKGDDKAKQHLASLGGQQQKDTKEQPPQKAPAHSAGKRKQAEPAKPVVVATHGSRSADKTASTNADDHSQKLAEAQRNLKKAEGDLEGSDKVAADIRARIAKAEPANRARPVLSPQEWDAQYRSASLLAPHEFLDRVKSVRVIVVKNAHLDKVVSDQELREMVNRRVQACGFNIDPRAPVTMFVTVMLDEVRHYFERSNSSRLNHAVMVGVDFELLARVYRNGAFVPLVVSPAADYSFETGVDKISRSGLEHALAKTMPRIMDRLRKPESKRDNTDAFQRTLWAKNEAPELYKNFLTARPVNAQELRRAFAGVKGVWNIQTTYATESVVVKHTGRKFINEPQLNSKWRARLRNIGLTVGDNGTVSIEHEARVRWHGPSTIADGLFTSDLAVFYACVDVIRAYEDNVVYQLNGDWFRGRVGIAVDRKIRTVLRDDIEKDFQKQAEDHLVDFVLRRLVDRQVVTR